MSKTMNKFAPVVRKRAVRLVLNPERDYPPRWVVVTSITEEIG